STRKMITCSSSGRSRITSATSGGGHSRNTSRSAAKSRASIMLLISGSKILPTTRRFYHSHLPKATTRKGFSKTLQTGRPLSLAVVFYTWNLRETFQSEGDACSGDSSDHSARDRRRSHLRAHVRSSRLGRERFRRRYSR